LRAAPRCIERSLGEHESLLRLSKNSSQKELHEVYTCRSLHSSQDRNNYLLICRHGCETSDRREVNILGHQSFVKRERENPDSLLYLGGDPQARRRCRRPPPPMFPPSPGSPQLAGVSSTRITFISASDVLRGIPDLTSFITLRATIPNLHRRVPVPRPTLRLLALGCRATVIATILGLTFHTLFLALEGVLGGVPFKACPEL